MCSFAQLGLTLCDPWTVAHQAPLSMGILQSRVLECVAISFSRGSSPPRDQTHVSCTASGFFTGWATQEAQRYPGKDKFMKMKMDWWLPAAQKEEHWIGKIWDFSGQWNYSAWYCNGKHKTTSICQNLQLDSKKHKPYVYAKKKKLFNSRGPWLQVEYRMWWKHLDISQMHEAISLRQVEIWGADLSNWKCGKNLQN